jgi:hypothetical protein
LAGWLKTQVIGGRKQLKAKDRWIQLWDKGQNRGPYIAFLDSPSDTKSLLELPLKDAMVINDATEGSSDFTVFALGSDVRFSTSAVSKTKWLEPLAKRTSNGLVMEKNTGRRATVVVVDGMDEKLGADAEC